MFENQIIMNKKLMTISLTPSTKERLETYAASQRRSVSLMADILLEQILDIVSPKPKSK